jgi:hypothetical protein
MAHRPEDRSSSEQQPLKQNTVKSRNVGADVSKLLAGIYYNPSRVGSYGGINLLLEQVNALLRRLNRKLLSKDQVETWLSGQEAYVLHKRVVTRRFKRNPMKYQRRVGSLFQADIIFYPDIPHHGYKYMLLVQDTHSRYLLHRFLKSKTCKEVLSRIKNIFEKIGFIPDALLVDSGLEWFCKEFKEWADQVGCNVYSIGSGDSGKLPMLDRATKYLQERLHTYFTHKETTNWVKVMPQLISSQNRTRNRSINATPKELWDARRNPTVSVAPSPGEIITSEKVKFKLGEWVSILGLELGSLSHRYKGQWTLAKFKIVEINDMKPERVVYYLEDELGERIKNGFYSNELTRANYPDQKRVERVLKTKTVAGVKRVLVRYKRRDKRYDEWIRESELESIPKVVVKRRRLK